MVDRYAGLLNALQGKLDKDETGSKFKCSDFIVADSSAFVVELKATIFEEIDKHKKRGITRMKGIRSSISAIAVHPHRSLLAIAGAEGFILTYDYMTKEQKLH